jgi:ABC-type branched-subunit amino acid transport system ATPase component
MVDEGASGMGYTEQDILAEDLRGYASRGLSVVLVEHNIPFVRSLADRVIVLNLGKKLAEGGPEEVLQRDDVRKAYLGDARA